MKKLLKKLICKLGYVIMTEKKLKRLEGSNSFQKIANADFMSGIAQVSYSQQAEDLALIKIFENKINGFFIDIGAFKPKLYSNTFLFYLKGWNGLNIEPNPDSINEFKVVRPRDINISCGISEEKGKLLYYKFNNPALNTFSQEHAEKWKNIAGFKIIDLIDIEIFTLAEILDKHLPKNQEIDFITIDVESFDLKVLKSNNWNKYNPKVIVVEEDIYDLKAFNQSEVFNFLENLGYKLSSVAGGTLIFTLV